MEISIGVLIDHHNRQIIYGDTKQVEYLEKSLGLEGAMFTNEDKYLTYFKDIITNHPKYTIVRAFAGNTLQHISKSSI